MAERTIPLSEIAHAATRNRTHSAAAAAKFAWTVVAYNVAVILWGAYVRATGSGAGCGNHWPLCDGVVLPVSPKLGTMIEFTHRASSGLALISVVALTIWTWRATSKAHWVRYAAVAALVLMLNEAILGALLVLLQHVAQDTSISRAVFLSLHFANTLLLVASLTLTARWLPFHQVKRAEREKGDRSPIVACLLITIITGIAGALSALGDTLFHASSLRSALLQDISPSSHFLLRLRTIHPAFAFLDGACILWLVTKGISKPGPSTKAFSFVTLIVFFVQALLGGLNVALLAPVWLQMLHLLVANVLWILLVLTSADFLSTDDRSFFVSPSPSGLEHTQGLRP